MTSRRKGMRTNAGGGLHMDADLDNLGEFS